MGYKCFVVMPDGEQVSNGLVFQTGPEASKYGQDLLSRWTQPESIVVRHTDDPVSHLWNFEKYQSEALPEAKTYHLDQADLSPQ